MKICGVQTRDEATAALAAAPPRSASWSASPTARDIVARLPAGTEAVLVTHLLDPERVADLAAAVGARTVQVHGDMAVADLRRLRALAPGLRLLKAVHVTGGDVLGRARAYADAADALVLDSRSADRLGGTGLTHNWAISADRRGVAPLPVYLAGGPRPANVEAAVARVRPAGVDVNSGVEDAAGRKDPARMRDFVARARAALG